jgi:hypothetical protein
VVIERIHRQRTLGTGGSLGVGAYLTFDKQLSISRDTSITTGVAAKASYVDPAHATLNVTFSEHGQGDTTVNGVLHDSVELCRELRFLKADGSTTADWLLATTARLTTADGRRLVFELFRLSSDPASTAREGRLIQELDRAGNASVVSYVYPVTASDATLGNDRSKLWQYSSVKDHFNQSATFVWDATKRGPRYAISRINLPNSTSLLYTYTGTALTSVDHPDGSRSTFSTSYDTTLQKTKYVWDDNAAGGTHMRKTTYVTGTSWTDPVTLAVRSQTAGQIVRLISTMGLQPYIAPWSSRATGPATFPARRYTNASTERGPR